jgi:hypothetical protein
MIIVRASVSTSHLSEKRWFVITRHLTVLFKEIVSGYFKKMLAVGGNEF